MQRPFALQPRAPTQAIASLPAHALWQLAVVVCLKHIRNIGINLLGARAVGTAVWVCCGILLDDAQPWA